MDDESFAKGGGGAADAETSGRSDLGDSQEPSTSSGDRHSLDERIRDISWIKSFYDRPDLRDLSNSVLDKKSINWSDSFDSRLYKSSRYIPGLSRTQSRIEYFDPSVHTFRNSPLFNEPERRSVTLMLEQVNNHPDHRARTFMIH